MNKKIKYTSGTLCLLLSLLSLQCGPRISKSDLRLANVHIETAQSHFMNGNFVRTETEARKALELTPDDPIAHRLLALSAFKLRKMPVALQHIKLAIENDPQNGELHNDLGGFYKYQKQYSDALIEFQRALDDKAFRAPAAALYNMAETYNEMGNFSKAKEYYRKSLKIDPNQDRPYYRLGMNAQESGDDAEALKMFEEGIKINKYNDLILKELCLIYCSEGSETGTKRYCTQFLKIIPEEYDDPYAVDRAKRCLYDFE